MEWCSWRCWSVLLTHVANVSPQIEPPFPSGNSSSWPLSTFRIQNPLGSQTHRASCERALLQFHMLKHHMLDRFPNWDRNKPGAVMTSLIVGKLFPVWQIISTEHPASAIDTGGTEWWTNLAKTSNSRSGDPSALTHLSELATPVVCLVGDLCINSMSQTDNGRGHENTFALLQT